MVENTVVLVGLGLFALLAGSWPGSGIDSGITIVLLVLYLRT